MQNLENLSPIIDEFNREIGAQNYNEAVVLYYKCLDRPLYWQGENKTIVDLLNVFVDKENNILTSIEQSNQERLLGTSAAIYKILGQPQKAKEIYQKLLRLYRRREDLRRCGIVLRHLSKIEMHIGKLADAESNLKEGIEIFKQLREKGLKSGMHRQYGILLTYEGKFEEAEEEIKYLPKNFGKHVHSDFAVYADMCMFALLSNRNIGKVIYYAKEMEKLTKKYPYKNDIVICEWLLGLSYLRSGDLERSVSHVDKALMICEETNYVEAKADILLTKSQWYYASKNYYHLAVLTAKKALDVAIESGYILKQADIHNFLGKLVLENGSVKIVEKHARMAHDLSTCDSCPHYYKLGTVEAEKLFKEIKVRPPNQYHTCFVSYSHQDKEFANSLVEALKIRDIECWVDAHKILPGDYCLGNIDKGIKKYDKFLLVCSKNSLTSFWVDTEIDKAVQKEKELWGEFNKRVVVMIPLDIDGYLHE